jgi:diguanylate cyclase (GGDEF)-like protein
VLDAALVLPWSLAALLVLGLGAAGVVAVHLVRRGSRDLAEARRHASRDDLTGALTRAAFIPLADQWLAPDNGREPVALLAIDLDDFGVVNKRAGHAEGDRVLARAAIRLQSACSNAVAVARVGGDEFLVLVPARHATTAADRIIAEIARTPVAGHKVGASVGIAIAPAHGDTPATLMAAADAALRTAKRSGKGQVVLSEAGVLPPGERAAQRERVTALWTENRVHMHVQPVVDLATQTVRGYEALARFDAPRGDAPLYWFAAADEVGLRLELELACLRSALDIMDSRPSGTVLSVNASPRLLGLPEAHAELRAVGDLHGLVLEITEDEIVEDYERLLTLLGPLLARGLELAVDDLGAGHATMRHVTALRPRYMKLDRSLVQRVDTDPSQAALVDALLGFAQRTDALLVAEGVETAAELDALARIGVPLAQGFHLGRPAEPWPLAPTATPRPVLPDDPTMALLHRSVVGEDAHRRFAADPTLQAAVVIDDEQRVLALLTRHRLLGAMGQRFGFALYGGRDVLAIADRHCLVVPAGLPHDRMVMRAMGRDAAKRYDPILVVDHQQRLVGHRTIQGLLEDGLAAADAATAAA